MIDAYFYLEKVDILKEAYPYVQNILCQLSLIPLDSIELYEKLNEQIKKLHKTLNCDEVDATLKELLRRQWVTQTVSGVLKYSLTKEGITIVEFLSLYYQDRLPSEELFVRSAHLSKIIHRQ